MIEFRNITKSYNNAIALNEINLLIEKGEFVFLVGPSGAGKSTFIKLLLKEIEPTEGEILISGKNINNLTTRQIPFYRRKVGMVFQDYNLIPNLTVYENIAFAMKVTGARKSHIKKNVSKILMKVGLSTKTKCFPNELSGGEQQRVALARAMISNPAIIIADEPTGNLDPSMSKEIVELLIELNKAGTTIIMATHDKEIVDLLSKRVIEIDNGKIIRDERRGNYK